MAGEMRIEMYDYKKYTIRLDEAENFTIHRHALKRLAWQILCGYAEEAAWEVAILHAR